jgi:GMP synthase (glutamine-hydrolysing)
MPAMKRILMLKAGEAALSERQSPPGDYDRWFFEALGGLGLRFDVVQAHRGEKLPPRGTYDGLLMAGSPLSVTEPKEWMLRAGERMREDIEHGAPVLGVCFGHQLLGRVYGAKVQRHPLGREVGTVDVELTDAGARDPLFDGVPRRFAVQATHEDLVAAAPAGATVLAGNSHSTVQAMALGQRGRAVQFHPELSPEGMRAVIQARAAGLEREAVQRGERPGHRVRALLDGIRPSPHARRLLRNFFERFF